MHFSSRQYIYCDTRDDERNCRDGHTTYFPDISAPPNTRWKKEELETVEEKAKIEGRKRYAKRQQDKYNRLERTALAPEDKRMYAARREEWSKETVNAERKKAYKDVLQEWLQNASPNSHKIQEMKEFIADGIVYTVDGTNVCQNNSKREIEVANLLQNTFGGEIKLVPEIKGKYKGVKTPDYIYNGERWDLKELNGSSKDAIRNAIKSKRKQADNFIIDITNVKKLTVYDIYKQAENVFYTPNTAFVNKLMIVEGDKVKYILSRK